VAGLTIKRDKGKALRINSTKEEPIKLNNKAMENVSAYLGSVIAFDGRLECNEKIM